MVKKPAVTHKKSMMFNLAHLLYCKSRCEWLIIKSEDGEEKKPAFEQKKFVMFQFAQVRYCMSRCKGLLLFVHSSK